jgi:hypothetical protein
VSLATFRFIFRSRMTRRDHRSCPVGLREQCVIARAFACLGNDKHRAYDGPALEQSLDHHVFNQQCATKISSRTENLKVGLRASHYFTASVPGYQEALFCSTLSSISHCNRSFVSRLHQSLLYLALAQSFPSHSFRIRCTAPSLAPPHLTDPTSRTCS